MPVYSTWCIHEKHVHTCTITPPPPNTNTQTQGTQCNGTAPRSQTTRKSSTSIQPPHGSRHTNPSHVARIYSTQTMAGGVGGPLCSGQRSSSRSGSGHVDHRRIGTCGSAATCICQDKNSNGVYSATMAAGACHTHVCCNNNPSRVAWCRRTPYDPPTNHCCSNHPSCMAWCIGSKARRPACTPPTPPIGCSNSTCYSRTHPVCSC